MDNQSLSVKKFLEFGHEYFYAVDLPNTEVSIPFEFFKQNNHGVYGQFARINRTADNTYECVRDTLGIGKAFYTRNNEGELHFSEQFRKLFPIAAPIFALPRGQLVRLGASGRRERIRQISPISPIALKISDAQITSPNTFHSSPMGELFKEILSKRIDVAFSLIKQLEENGFVIFIALSGGLDSSIIAALARKHLKNPTACTLDLGQSEDAEKSALISRVLDIEQVIFETSEQEILTAVEESPVSCQDFRDFNVHCTALNLLLAKKIRALADNRGVVPSKAVVLTGDIMNEFTCDYHSESVEGVTYYRLPRVNHKMLQRMLIGGLDTSDREILPFNLHGLSCIQPYAILYDLYTALPESLFEIEDVKRILNGHLVPSKVLELLPKSKLRAQVGSRENMGVLGLCHRRGIDENYFLKKLMDTEQPDKNRVPITMGRYEIETFDM